MSTEKPPEPEKEEPWAKPGAEPVNWEEHEKAGKEQWPDMDGDD